LDALTLKLLFHNQLLRLQEMYLSINLGKRKKHLLFRRPSSSLKIFPKKVKDIKIDLRRWKEIWLISIVKTKGKEGTNIETSQSKYVEDPREC
jgi:hypothetical protein